MTISIHTPLSISSGDSNPSVAAFSSSQAGITYKDASVSNTVSGFLLDISGNTITKAGAEANLYTTPAGFSLVFNTLCPSSPTKLRLLVVRADVSPARVAEIVPVTKTATQLNGGSPSGLSLPGDPNPTFFHAANNWDGSTLCMINRISTNTFMLTLAGDASQGNVISFSSAATINPSILPVFVPFDASNGVMYYWNSSAADLYGVALSKSGLTLTEGSQFQVNATSASGSSDIIGACFVSSSRQAAGHIDNLADPRIQTIDSPTTVNADTILSATDIHMHMMRFHQLSVVVKRESVTTTRWSEFTVAAGGGLTNTNTVSNSNNPTSDTWNIMDYLEDQKIISTIGEGTLEAVILTTDVVSGAATDTFTTGGLIAKPVDIDADGSFLYIAALDSLGEPTLIKFSTALDSDGSAVFQPGAGSDIGVQCGRFDSDVVWIAGAFDGTNTVEKSEDAGVSFTVKDPGIFGAVSTFIVGPDSDDRVLIVDDGVDIQETINGGGEWIAKNTGLTPVTKSLARLGINVEEVVFGNESGANDNVDYSINTGADLEDLNLPVTADVNDIIVN